MFKMSPPEEDAKLLVQYLMKSLTAQVVTKSLTELISRENAINFALDLPNGKTIIEQAKQLIRQQTEMKSMCGADAKKLELEINQILNMHLQPQKYHAPKL